ncbi:MAG: hypothetical protein FJ123_00435 [Deltaproteobacteria bacterium]|nr:hypothetical protein [Deltaproteobacteria bacterium]
MEKERFQEILNQVAEIHERNRDYEGDDHSNFRLCERMGLPAWKGVLVMMAEEMGRLMNVAKSENPEVDLEAVGETLTELAAHSIMARIFLEESPGGKPQDASPRRGRRQGQRERKDAAELSYSLPEDIPVQTNQQP